MRGKWKRLPTLFGFALITAVLLAASGSAIQPDPDVTSPTGAGSDGRGAPDFEIAVYHGAEALGGQEVHFSDVLDQGKPVVLNLWAGLCPPCRLEMPDFQEVSEAFGDDILLIGLDVGPFTNLGSSEDGQALVQQLRITYPTGTTSDAGIMRDVGLLGMPTTLFITPEGEVVQSWTGLLTKDKLTELVEVLLETSESS